jgi:hypothetical protein
LSPELIRVLIAAALLLHGVAHGKAFFELLRDAAASGNRATVPVRSWLRPSLSRRTVALLASPFWLVSAFGFIVASLSFWGILETGNVWRQTAAVSCAVSTLGLILFCGVWPGVPNRRLSALDVAIAMVMNAGIVVLLLAAGWPPEAMFGK